MMFVEFLIAILTLLLDQAILQPAFKCLVALLLLDLFFKSLCLFHSKLLLRVQSISYQLALLPLEHTVSTILIVSIQCSLLHDHLFEEVFLRLKD